jgi:hypothetical protein
VIRRTDKLRVRLGGSGAHRGRHHLGPFGCLTGGPVFCAGAVPRPQDDAGHRHDYLACMNLPPDQPPALPAKPKLSAEERRARHADRLIIIRLRMLIRRELDDRDITTPAEIGAALGMPTVEATKLMSRHQWREGDVAQLEAAAARLGVQVPEPPQLFGATRR